VVDDASDNNDPKQNLQENGFLMMEFFSLKKYRIFILTIAFSYIAKNLYTIDINRLLWDLSVYVRAVNDYIQGNDPYRQDVSLLFIYHPYVLKTFTFFNYLFSIKIWLICFYVTASTMFIREFFLFSRLHQETFSAENKNFIVLLLLAAVCFGDAGLVAVKTGNITIFLHFLLLATFFYAYREKSKKSVMIFALSIIICSIIKPYLLAYVLLLPFLRRWRTMLYLGLTIFLVCFFIWMSGAIAMSELYSSFMNALQHQTLGKGYLGYSIFGLIQGKTGKPLGLILHSVIMLSYLFLVLLYSKKLGSHWNSSQFIPLVIIFIIFINPRMKVYDFPIAILFSFLYLWLFVKSPARAVKVIVISMLLSSVPTAYRVLVALGDFESNPLLLNTHHLFHILGFILVLVGIMFSAFEQLKSVSSSKYNRL